MQLHKNTNAAAAAAAENQHQSSAEALIYIYIRRVDYTEWSGVQFRFKWRTSSYLYEEISTEAQQEQELRLLLHQVLLCVNTNSVVLCCSQQHFCCV